MPQKTSHFSLLPESIQNLIDFLIRSKAIRKIVLFGSRARGTARDNSDYDFALWLDDKSQWPLIASEVEERNLSLLPVDLVIYDDLSLDYRTNIDKEGIKIYGKP